MSDQNNDSSTFSYSLIFNIIGIVAVLAIVGIAIYGSIVSPDVGSLARSLNHWMSDSAALVMTLGLIAFIAFVSGVIIEYLQYRNGSKLYIKIGVISGLLALLVFPSAPLVTRLLCTNFDVGCSFSSIGLVVYFIAAIYILLIISIIAFALGSSKNIDKN